MPIVTRRVEALERSPNTTPAVTNAAAMNGVPRQMTIAGKRKPVMCPTTVVATAHTTTPTTTIGHRWRARPSAPHTHAAHTGGQSRARAAPDPAGNGPRASVENGLQAQQQPDLEAR